jgi:hypothetical protein
MFVKDKVRVALLEFENKQHLNKTDQKVIDFILGETIDEVNSSELINRLISVLKSNQRKFITAAVISTLMANPSFSQAYQNTTKENKNLISQLTNINSNIRKENKKAEYSINLTNSFKSGAYEIDEGSVLSKLNSLKGFLNSNSNVKYSIKITASESQVPNQNNLKSGELANMRVNKMSNLVNSYLKQNNLNIKIDKVTNIGDVPWDGYNKDDEKYTKDQYVRLDVFLEGKNEVKPCEISFSKNDGSQSSEKNGYLSFEQQLNDGGEMNISPGSIPDRMVITSNGNIIADTGYFVDKQHNYKEWKLVPLYVAELTQINIPNPKIPAMEGLKDLKKFNSFDELLNTLLNDSNYDYLKDSRNEIKNGVIKLKQLWDSGQREFVFYTMKKGILKYDVNDSETKVSVYSPVGKTGFNLKGNCN